MAKVRKKQTLEEANLQENEQTTKQAAPEAEFNRLMEAMREEVAREFGLPGTDSAYFADLSSRLCGKFGHTLMQRAKALSRQTKEHEDAQDAHQQVEMQIEHQVEQKRQPNLKQISKKRSSR